MENENLLRKPDETLVNSNLNAGSACKIIDGDTPFLENNLHGPCLNRDVSTSTIKDDKIFRGLRTSIQGSDIIGKCEGPWDNDGSQQRNPDIAQKLDEFENLVRLQFGDSLSCMPVITSSGSKFVSIWNDIPEYADKDSFSMKYLPLFYIIGAPDEKSNLELKLITFHGKVIEELKDSPSQPLNDGCKIEFVDKLRHLKLCQGVKSPNIETKHDLHTLSTFYLIEQLEHDIVIRSRNCNFALYEDSGSTVCSMCLALNRKEPTKKKKHKTNHNLNSLTIFGEGSSTTIFPNPFGSDYSEDTKPLVKVEVNDVNEFQETEDFSNPEDYSLMNEEDSDYQWNMQPSDYPPIHESDVIINQKFNIPSTISIYPEGNRLA